MLCIRPVDRFLGYVRSDKRRFNTLDSLREKLLRSEFIKEIGSKSQPYRPLFRIKEDGSQLTPEQLKFVETFVRCEGKITRMEVEIGLSYPTIRNRLLEVIRSLSVIAYIDHYSAGWMPFVLGRIRSLIA